MSTKHEGLTLEKLPQAISLLTEEVSEIKSLLLQQANAKPTETDGWFNLDELCEYLPDRPSKQTVYDWVHDRNIPVHKGPKKLRFLKSEVDKWLHEGRKKTQVELAKEANSYLLSIDAKKSISPKMASRNGN